MGRSRPIMESRDGRIKCGQNAILKYIFEVNVINFGERIQWVIKLQKMCLYFLKKAAKDVLHEVFNNNFCEYLEGEWDDALMPKDRH